MSHGLLGSIEKLSGRENYDSWKVAAKAYLVQEDLWDVVTGTDVDPKRNLKAHSKIVLLIDKVNYAHVLSTESAKTAWENLEKTFQDSGLTRRVSLLRTLITTTLEKCDSVESYVNDIVLTASKLNAIKFVVPDEWVGVLLLAGLPEKYEPMIMGIESSGVAITGDSIKTKILQDVKYGSSESSSVALISNNSTSNRKFKRPPVRCFECNKFGHFANNCPNKKTASDTKPKKTMFTALMSEIKSTDWYVDSGASAHMVAQNVLFNQKTDLSSNNKVVTADNSCLQIQAVGDVKLKSNNGESIDVQDVLYVPNLCANLISVSQAVEKGNTVIFNADGCKIVDLDGETLITAKNENGMYKINQVSPIVSFMANRSENEPGVLWHRRMGHLNHRSLQKLMLHADKGTDYTTAEPKNGVPCVKGKQTRLPFKESEIRASEKLELVHSDVCGPIECLSIGGARFLLVFVDDFTRKVFLYILKSKTEVLSKFVEFKNLVETQTGNKIKILRTDNGTEYCNNKFDEVCKNSGIQHQLTAPYTPEQNGVAERMNRTLVERSRCMMFDANLDKSFWAEAVSTAAYLINRSPCRSIGGKCPEELWSGRTVDLSRIRVFGCVCYIHIPKQKRKKFDSKSTMGIFTGYCENSKAYRIYIPEKGETEISRDVVFFEDQHYKDSDQVISDSDKTNYFYSTVDNEISVGELSTVSPIVNTVDLDDAINLDEVGHSEAVAVENSLDAENDMTDVVTQVQDMENIPENEFVSSEGSSSSDSSHGDLMYSCDELDSDDEYVPESSIENQATDVRRSTRPKKPVDMNDYVTYKVHSFELDDPLTVTEALNRADKKHWEEAMKSEMNSLQDNKTWDLVDLPLNRKPINCKWVFKTKRDASGKILRYKARLVIKGCAQTKGIDYEETYSPVVRYSSIRLLLAIAAKYDLDIDQMDAVTAFLQGDLSEEIYMLQPEGFGTDNRVCRLKKSLYGLKQASRNWNCKLDSALKKCGLHQSKYDACIYYKIDGAKMMYISVYVDDLLIFTNDQNWKKTLKINLMTSFEMKDIGEARFVLGMQITRNRDDGKLWIDQSHYIEQMLFRFNMANCNPVSTPIDINQKLSTELCPKTDSDRQEMETIPYQQAIGSLLYAAQVSRPDLCYAVNFLSRFNKNPGKAHWNAVKRVFRYLRGTVSAKLEFSKNEPPVLTGYSDSDWASDLDQRRSTTGFVFTLQGGPISWNSRKQPTVALSTTEAEYMALSSTCQEALWLINIQKELIPSSSSTIDVNCDNKSAIILSSSNSYYPRSKHIDVRHHFVRDVISDGRVKIHYTPTNQMVADVMTKGLNTHKHQENLKMLGLKI